MRKRQAPEIQPVAIDQLLTVPEAAAKLGIGRTKLYELINTNQLPYVEIPGRGECAKRISALTLNSWIRSQETLKHGMPAPLGGEGLRSDPKRKRTRERKRG